MSDRLAGARRHTIETNGIRMAVTEQGAGPAVVLCHGFPSWGTRGAIRFRLWPKRDFG